MGDANQPEREPTDYWPWVADEGDPDITWAEVQAVLAKLPSSLAEDFRRERDERF